MITQLDVDLSDPDKDYKTMRKLNQFLAAQKKAKDSVAPDSESD